MRFKIQGQHMKACLTQNYLNNSSIKLVVLENIISMKRQTSKLNATNKATLTETIEEMPTSLNVWLLWPCLATMKEIKSLGLGWFKEL